MYTHTMMSEFQNLCPCMSMYMDLCCIMISVAVVGRLFDNFSLYNCDSLELLGWVGFVTSFVRCHVFHQLFHHFVHIFQTIFTFVIDLLIDYLNLNSWFELYTYNTCFIRKKNTTINNCVFIKAPKQGSIDPP